MCHSQSKPIVEGGTKSHIILSFGHVEKSRGSASLEHKIFRDVRKITKKHNLFAYSIMSVFYS